MDKGIIDKLGIENLDVKQFIDWNEAYQQEELTLNLQEHKSRLQAELSESIESHVIRKEKNLEELSKAIQVILAIKKKTAQALQEAGSVKGQKGSENRESVQGNIDVKENAEDELSLQTLVELIGIKNHVDYCLEKLQPIVNNENNDYNQENDQANLNGQD